MKNIITPSIFTLLTLPMSINIALAQQSSNSESFEEIEKIVVTADLSQRDLSELPGSVLILDEETIKARQARHLEDLLGVVPNLNFASGATRGKFVQIRGVGERSQFAEPINPSIGVLLDNIDISGIGSLATVYDLAQLEVLSGPQSVASGINSIGGVVKLVTNPAISEEYGKFSVSIAEFNERQLAGVYNTALTDNLNARFSLQQNKSDGFIKNSFLNRSDTNGVDELTFTGKFDLMLKGDKTLKAAIYKFNIDNGYDAFSLDNDRVTRSDEPGNDSVDATAASLTYSQPLLDHDLQLNMFHLNADTEYGYDEDWTFDGFDPIGYTSTDVYFRDIIRTGLDAKLASNKTENYSYLLGASFVQSTEDLLRQNTFLEEDYISQYQPSSTSIYGQYMHIVDDKLTLTTAARLESFKVDFNDNFGNTKLDDTLIAASVVADYKLGTGFVFASISRGYKAAGFNIDSRLAVADRTYDAEINYSYEFGVKGTAFDNLANINLTWFYMDRKDAQVDDSIVIPIDDSGASSFVDGIGNADAGTNKGFELTTTWDLTDNYYVQANLGYLDATFGNYTRLDGEFVPLQQQAHAPKYTAYVGSNWQISDDVKWHIDAQYKSDFRLGLNHGVKASKSYVVNSELAYTSSGKHNYVVKLWVKNLFDEDIITRGFGSFPNDPRDGYESFGPYFQYGQPQQFGLTFEYEWL